MPKYTHIKNTNHNYTKVNLVTIIEGERTYDLYRCSLCDLEGKRYGIGGNYLEVDGRTSDARLTNCPNVKKPKRVKVTRCTAMGKKFANLTPDSIHDIVPPPPPHDDTRGVWVMGVGEAVMLLHGEYVEFNG